MYFKDLLTSKQQLLTMAGVGERGVQGVSADNGAQRRLCTRGAACWGCPRAHPEGFVFAPRPVNASTQESGKKVQAPKPVATSSGSSKPPRAVVKATGRDNLLFNLALVAVGAAVVAALLLGILLGRGG